MPLNITKSNRRPGINDTARIRTCFNVYDTNHDGVISLSELSAMLTKMGIRMSEEHKHEFFDLIDVDKSGQIEFGEFLDWYTTVMDLADKEAQAMLVELQKTTAFTRAELETIYDNYKKVSASVIDDGTIDLSEFKQMMMAGGVPSQNSFLIDGLFRMFDADNNGTITFEELATILSIYHNKHNKGKDEKHKLMFSIYDVDNDGKISRQDMCKILNDCLSSNNIHLEEADILKIVDATFKRNGCGQQMDFNAYMKEVRERKLE